MDDKSVQLGNGVGSGMDGGVNGGVGCGLDVGLQGGSHGVSQYEAEHERMDGSISQSEIELRLSEAGITAVFRRNAAGRLTGATFIDHTTRTVYNGSALDKKLSANNWHELFAENRPSAADTTTTALHQHAHSAAATSHQSSMPTTTTTSPPHPALAAEPSTDRPTMSLPADPPTRGGQFADEYTIIMNTPSPEQHSHFEDTTLISPRHEHDEPSDDYEHYEYDTDPTRTTFRGLSHQGHTPEEIAPEFRTLHKRKKPHRKMR